MGRRLLNDLGELQRAALEVVWELGEASVHQVRDQLGRRKKLAYTTVLTALQKLEKAGWLRHRSEGKSYVYCATRSRDEASSMSVRRFVDRIFQGDALAMFQHLIREGDLDDRHLQELKDMIEEKRREGR